MNFRTFVTNQPYCLTVPSYSHDGSTFEDVGDDRVSVLQPSENVYFQSTFLVFCVLPGNAILKNCMYFLRSIVCAIFEEHQPVTGEIHEY